MHSFVFQRSGKKILIDLKFLSLKIGLADLKQITPLL